MRKGHYILAKELKRDTAMKALEKVRIVFCVEEFLGVKTFRMNQNLRMGRYFFR